MRISEETLKKLIGLTESMIGEDGLEYPNPNPLVVDVGPKRLSLRDQVKRILREEVSKEAYKQGFETFDEANDFDVEDEDPLPLSGFEHQDLVEDVAAPPVEPKATPAEPEKEPVEEPADSPPLDVD